MRISYSALDTYKTCPLKFKWQILDKLKTPKSKEALFGSAIHSSLKYMFTHSPLFPTQSEVINFFRNNWQEKTEKYQTIWNEQEKKQTSWDKQVVNTYLDSGMAILKNFYKHNPPWNYNILNLESRFDVILEGPETKTQHILAGIIDRIDKNQDGSYEIIDYKTTSRMPSQDKLNQDLQLSIYHLGLLKQWPHLEFGKVKLSLYFLKHREKITTTRTQKELDKTKKVILSNINEIQEKQKTDDFPPLPSGLCDWCGFRPICPMWKHEYKETQNAKHKTQSEIEGLVSEYFELKSQNSANNERISQIQQDIHTFMDNEKIERVFADIGYLTRNVRTANVYDLKKAREILGPLGLWNRLLKVDQVKIEKLIPSLPQDAQNQLKQAILETKQTRTLTSTKKKKHLG